MNKLFTLLMLSACLFSYAQEVDTTYHNAFGMECDADSAHFYRVTTFSGEQQYISEYFTSNQQLRRKGLEIKSGDRSLREGLWKSFYENGNPKSETTYEQGVKTDTSKEWFENGQQEAIWNHDKGNTTLLSCWRPDGAAIVTAGEGMYEKYFPGGQLHYSGPVQEGKQTGNWKAYHNDGQLMHDVTIQDGSTIGTQQMWSASGQKIYESRLLPSGTQEVVTYWQEGGEVLLTETKRINKAKANWISLGVMEPYPINMNEVTKTIGYPEKAQGMGVEGQLIVRVMVNEQGEIIKDQWFRTVHPILKDAVQAHLYELKFAPAIQQGKYIKFWVHIPFRFKLLDDGGGAKRKKRRRNG